MEKNKIVIHTDGGSRGNPGPAAAGVIIEGENIGKKEYAEYLGEMTNNEAEYRALILGLKKLKQIAGGEVAEKSSVEVYMDSELIVRQLNGEYKIKEKHIQELFFQVWNMKLDFGSVSFKHIPREENRDADKLVNQALDREASKLDL